MAITFDEGRRIFTLTTTNTMYQMQADSFGYLLHLYYGRKFSGVYDWGLPPYDRGFSCTPYGNNRTYSLDCLPFEFPAQGSGDFRSSVLEVRDYEGTFGCDLRYSGCEIREGKYSLDGLPAVYANEEAQTLIITLKNERLGLRAELLYGVIPGKDIITRSAVITNEGNSPFTITKLQTACLNFTHGRFDLMTFHGRHTLEMQPERRELRHGSYSVGSRRGASSHQYNPFMILTDHDATETHGRCWAMMFVYSGGFLAEAELDQYNQTRIQMGLSSSKLAYTLNPGEKITAPEVIMTFSGEGLETLSHRLHECIRKNICRGKFRDIPRPIVLNSWEAFYFDFDGRKVLDLANEAKSLGVDMLVLDDGWFINRGNDERALGDWTADEGKLGCSLAEIIAGVNSIGLDFGLWVEPEMVSEDSNLYRTHPDWAMTIPGERPSLGRQQLVLDMSRRDVIEYVYNSVSKILQLGGIKYLKWDYNRSISDVYSHAEESGRVLYDYMLGLYEVLERLNKNYPDVMIEGCSGGGGRFDAGMMYYTPQIWCSDNTDALDRMMIHYGVSFGYPSSVIGSHVSVCPNHQTGRITPLNTRFNVARSGAFGYELNPKLLSDSEKDEIRRQILTFKNERGIITDGLYYRLSNPLTEDYCAWEYVSHDGTTAIISAVIPQNHGNIPLTYIVPRGLTAGAFYRNSEDGKIFPADALMEAGFPLMRGTGDYMSFTVRLERM